MWCPNLIRERLLCIGSFTNTFQLFFIRISVKIFILHEPLDTKLIELRTLVWIFMLNFYALKLGKNHLYSNRLNWRNFNLIVSQNRLRTCDPN